MSATAVDPEKVIARLSQQMGAMAAQIAMQEVALEAAQARLSELEAAPSEATSA